MDLDVWLAAEVRLCCFLDCHSYLQPFDFRLQFQTCHLFLSNIDWLLSETDLAQFVFFAFVRLASCLPHDGSSSALFALQVFLSSKNPPLVS